MMGDSYNELRRFRDRRIQRASVLLEVKRMETGSLNYNSYLKIASGIYWVGSADAEGGLHCNPYLIVEGDEAVLLDSGSRNDFSTVMLKILRTGVDLRSIRRLIYHHYDPDLCGNIPHMEAVINNPELKLISHEDNNVFITYYAVNAPKLSIEQMGMQYRFASGRTLRFILTPYSHSPGSFVTYDTQTRTLFSSDLFGCYDPFWTLYTRITDACENCDAPEICPRTGEACPIRNILSFHTRIMTSRAALQYALDQIEALDVALIAPQHGSLLHTPEARRAVIRQLRGLESVGIEHFLKERGV